MYAVGIKSRLHFQDKKNIGRKNLIGKILLALRYLQSQDIISMLHDLHPWCTVNIVCHTLIMFHIICLKGKEIRARGNKTFFMLNCTEH